MVQVTVTVDDEHLTTIAGVADTLRETGMQVDSVLDGLGIVTGSIDADKRDAVQAVEGVASVDMAMDVQLPPPDAPVQ